MSMSGLKEDSDSDSDSEFSNILERIRSRPQSQVKLTQNKLSDSEDEELEFLEFAERFRTPRTCVKNNKGVSLSSPGFPEKQKLFSSVGSKRTFNLTSDVYQTVCKPPQSQNVLHHLKGRTSNDNGSDDFDGEISILSENIHRMCTPRSQNRNAEKTSDFSPHFPEKQKLFHTTSANKENPRPLTDKFGESSFKKLKSKHEEEFATLFSEISLKSSDSFCRRRVECAEKLFSFFNRTIFDSKLPQNMPIIWDNLLTSTAGKAYLSYSKEVYSCSIKLSTQLLTSFDKLQDTLLHEMCHAAVWSINNIRNVNHGPLWQVWAARCNMILPFVKCPERCHNYEVSYRIWYQCTSCNLKIGRLKQSQKLAKSVCKKCKTPLVSKWA